MELKNFAKEYKERFDAVRKEFITAIEDGEIKDVVIDSPEFKKMIAEFIAGQTTAKQKEYDYEQELKRVSNEA